ncbi:ATP-dependent RNA helicase HelY [Frankineae bacterium MT45]|nr:ATP-dependent RNA helicase HelY [Frankineae bacterium MT45]
MVGTSETSPAERYAAAKRRTRHPQLGEFQTSYPFELDPFQLQACEAVEDGYSVLVCAPTGSGKTVVGEFAVHMALASGQKCFYTTPIKALSNQKFNDLAQRYGEANVGLLTGDNAVNADAPIVVMTTEVLRNMLYVGSPGLVGLGYVVMDEVHYLGDRYRGAVWEEVIIHLSASVRLISLSATVSNAEEFGDWLVSVRGETRVIVHEIRPVPLWQHMLVGNRLFDLFTANDSAGDGDDPGVGTPQTTNLNPDLRRYVSDRNRELDAAPRRGERRGARGWRPPYRPDVIARLDREALLPLITFIFSRVGCDAAVKQCVDAGLWLTTPEERDEISLVAERRISSIPAEDLEILGYWDWLDGLRRGIAAHHAGLIPAFKETVEELFTAGLVRVVFATETLALGINMPARSVVLERLTKFNGESHADVTPGEYTQLTGRAGRRGIDVEGHAVVLWGPDVDPMRVAGLASTRTFPLRSSFRPSYNMAVNLVGQLGRPAARELLESSFAQFQADSSVAGLANQIRRNQHSIDGYRKKMQCHLGDFGEYAAMRAELTEREKSLSREGARTRRATVVAALEKLRPGDVIRVPSGRRAGLAVVIDAGVHPREDPRPLVLTLARWGGRLALADFPTVPDVLATVRVPRNFNYRSPQDRRDLSSTLRALDLPERGGRREKDRQTSVDDPHIVSLREALRHHPCHGCSDREEHARWAERATRLERENAALSKRIEGRTNSLGRTFDLICRLLNDRGYLDGDTATSEGRRLSRIWSESDLVIAECLKAGIWNGLDAGELAGAVSTLVYEARRDEQASDRMPTAALATAISHINDVWSALADAESSIGLTRSREPELGFVWASYRWVKHESLDRVLRASAQAGVQMSAGDFVRWCKQLLDLLEQIAAAPAVRPEHQRVAEQARTAARAIRRGVVAQGMGA